jgi:hypothetical protein
MIFPEVGWYTIFMGAGERSGAVFVHHIDQPIAKPPQEKQGAGKAECQENVSALLGDEYS